MAGCTLIFQRVFAATVISVLCVLTVPGGVHAQPVDPYVTALLGQARVYSDPTADAGQIRTPRLSYPALVRELGSVLEQDPRFLTIDEEDLLAAARTAPAHEMIEYIHVLRDRGIEEFGLFEIDSSIDSLETAIRRYVEAGAALTRPRDLAMAYEYLARAQIERANIAGDGEQRAGDLASARHAFKELILLNPNAEIREGLFPHEVVELFREVYIGLLFDDGLSLGMTSSSARSLITQIDLDYVFHPYFIRDDASVRLVLQVFDRSASEVFRAVVPLTADTETSLERVNRVASRFVACIHLRRETIPGPEPVDAGHLFLQAGWGFTYYGVRPTDKQFLNQGISVSLDYLLTENFGFFGRGSVLFGERDSDGDLLAGFTSVRSTLGLILSMRFDWLRIWFGTGVEYNRVGSFQATGDFWCKVSNGNLTTYAPGSDCRSTEVARVDARNMFGAYLMPGLSFDVISPFSLYLNGNFGFYLSDNANDVDFPLSGEGGIEYRF